MKLYIWIVLLFQVILAADRADRAHHTKLLHRTQDNFTCLILEDKNVRKFKGFTASKADEIKAFMKPAVYAPSEMMLTTDDTAQVVEIYARSLNALDSYVDSLCKSIESLPDLSIQKLRTGLDVEKIVDGGDPANRIDVVFMGDGYTADEREQFFDDIRRLTDDMFNGDTFRSYLPLFNIWALYVESVESGIGYDGPKDTAFKLYRTAGQLRGVFTANAQFARQLCQEMGPFTCDYPSIIGNDDYYGGLEGEFVISTKSHRTGTVVLRHEMGHNFVNVGEEYDNGSSYFGVNSASNLANVTNKWGHWLSGQSVREERVAYRLLAYPWADLSRGEQSFTFTSDGNYSRWYLLVSVSAAGEENSLEFVLDGEVLPWQSRLSDDREFYDWHGDEGFRSGEHSFIVRSVTPSTNLNIPRMICSITLHEFGTEEEFQIQNDIISAYPTWDVFRRVSFRPTNAGCLMRNMTSTSFCSVCKEGMWYQFLQRISLIDEVKVNKTPNADRTKRVVVNTLKLGQLREDGTEIDNERLEIRWSHGGLDRPEFDDKFEIDAEGGAWSVFVRFFTPEVRYDPNGLLQDVEHFTVTFQANSTTLDML